MQLCWLNDLCSNHNLLLIFPLEANVNMCHHASIYTKHYGSILFV